MSPTTILSVYLQIQLALSLAYLLLLGLRRLSNQLNIVPGIMTWKRIAQLLVCVALFAPPLLGSLPQHSLPKLSFRLLEPTLESESSPGHSDLSKPMHLSLSRIETQTLTTAATHALDWKDLALPLLALAFAVALVRARRAYLSLRSVRGILTRSLVLRNIGEVTVALSSEAQVPFSIRLARAWIVVPSEMISRRKDFRIAIAHELQHHRQCDTLWSWGFEALQCVFALNPLVRHFRRSVIEFQELSCDEALLLRKRFSTLEYGSCLLRVAETALKAREVHVGTTCMAAGFENPEENQSFLMRRLEMMTYLNRTRARSWVGVVLGTLAASLTLTFAYGAQQSLRPENPNTINPGTALFSPEVQEIAENALQRQLEKMNAESGFAIVADPNTGQILAAANLIRQGAQRPGHWALSERLEPASVLKGLIAATVLDQKLTTPEEVFDCGSGNYQVGDQVYHDHRSFDHLSTADTVVHSSNICGIRVAERLGPQRLSQALLSYGLGAGGTAREFPEARSGQLPTLDTRPESQYLAQIASGYSNLEVTPLELVQAFGAIANGGLLLKPLAFGTLSPAVPVRRLFSPETATQMRRILSEVVTRGTAKAAESSLYSTAGKTGTGFHPSLNPHGGFTGRGSVGQFIGFAPVHQPRLVVYAVVTLPAERHGAGGESAGPIFKEIAEKVLQKMSVAPDKPAVN